MAIAVLLAPARSLSVLLLLLVTVQSETSIQSEPGDDDRPTLCGQGKYAVQEKAVTATATDDTIAGVPGLIGKPKLGHAPGYYKMLASLMASAATYCDDCHIGKYQSLTGQNSCAICTAGSVAQPGSSMCRACPLGQFSDHQRGSCVPLCPDGTYAIHRVCTFCPLGKYSGMMQACA